MLTCTSLTIWQCSEQGDSRESGSAGRAETGFIGSTRFGFASNGEPGIIGSGGSESADTVKLASLLAVDLGSAVWENLALLEMVDLHLLEQSW